MDRSLLKYILHAHYKVQNKFLYLETGVFGIKEIITSRRCLYFYTILQRDNEELTRYNAQRNNPHKGDWILMLKKDLEEMEISFNEEEIMKQTKCQFRSKIKRKLRDNMFKVLKNEQKGHSKISHICYSTFKVQEYLKTHIMNNHEVSLLFALRSRSAKSFRANFPFYSEKMCPHCVKEEGSQEHYLQCEIIYPPSISNNYIEYSDIFSEDVIKQAAVAQLFATLIERREYASASSTGPSNCQGFPVQCDSSVNYTNCASD